MGSLWPDSTSNLGTVLVRITTSCLRKQIGLLWNTISNNSSLSKSCCGDFCSEPFSGLPSWLTTDNLGCRMFFRDLVTKCATGNILFLFARKSIFWVVEIETESSAMVSGLSGGLAVRGGLKVWVLDYSPTVFFIGFVRLLFSFSSFASFAWTATFLPVTHSFLFALLYQTLFFP